MARNVLVVDMGLKSVEMSCRKMSPRKTVSEFWDKDKRNFKISTDLIFHLKWENVTKDENFL